MGYVVHRSLIVTINDWEGSKRAASIRDTVAGIMGDMACLVTPLCSYFKETHSFAVLPDGEKEFWRVSDLAEERMGEVKSFLTAIEANRRQLPRPHLYHVDWVEVKYGGDSYEAKIEDQSWRE